MKLKTFFLAAALAAVCTSQAGAQTLTVLGTYKTGVFDEGAAEIGAFDPGTDRLFVVNGDSGDIDVLDISDPTAPVKLFAIDLGPYGDGANSVDVKNGVVAAAVEAENSQDNGKAVFFEAAGQCAFLSAVTVGALPDMLTFTPDGAKVLVANEGEPDDDLDPDPEGTVSIIDISGGVANLTQANVSTAGFAAYNGAQLDDSVRVFTPGSAAAQDFEPEYIAVSPDSKTAWVTLQENNAVAVVDIDTATVTAVAGLGFKDHSLEANALDPSDKDDAVNIAAWPVLGMYQPDAIAAVTPSGTTYLITAKEGDSRDYDNFSEEARIKDLALDPAAFPNAAELQQDENIGRLETTTTLGDDDGDGDYDRLFCYGARSFSVRDASGNLVWDSGDDIERITADALPEYFNSSNDDNDSFDSRSDAKGPEPEGIAVGFVAGKHLAFVCLERIGGVLMYDVTDPTSPQFLQYVNNRDFDGDPEDGTAGDLGPEGLHFIPAIDSPTYQPLLAVMNEISGSTTIYRIDAEVAAPEIIGVAEGEETGIVISGTPGAVYEVALEYPDGTTETTVVEIGADGRGVAVVTVVAGMVVEAAEVGALGAPGNATYTVSSATAIPSLNQYGIAALMIVFSALGIAALRRRISSIR